MRLVFTESAWQDYLWFQEKDRQLLKRINQLLKDGLRTPFEGLGKPEPLNSFSAPSPHLAIPPLLPPHVARNIRAMTPHMSRKNSPCHLWGASGK